MPALSPPQLLARIVLQDPEVNQVPHRAGLPDLSLPSLAAYQRALDGETLPADTPGLADLVAAKILVPFPGKLDVYVPVNPGSGTAHLLEIMQHQLEGLTAFTARLPSFLESIRDEFDARNQSGSDIQHLIGRDTINGRIADQHTGAQYEILSAQPGARTEQDLQYSFGRDHSALTRGLRMRTIYHQSVRRTPNVTEWAQRMSAAGGEIRTLNGRFTRSIIFDRRVAFVPVYDGDNEPPADQALMITNRLAVGRIAADFDNYWGRAAQWFGPNSADTDTDDDTGSSDGLMTTTLQRCILRELCEGHDQRQAAKNLGISVAWINRQMTQLRKKIGVANLNATIHWWCRSPEYDIED
jgi:DNA-binding CsgD family transcriptional regulator